ncbi:MAG: hypothetical protein MSA33_02325 [Campylobacter sp.]|uniref:hypothetical protein n=1 Tax=Campylobacter sp. TaxID=205 RepID=UPI002AA89031|nr:hypothetical protein [Campylobacter sp.]MCI7549277.1 hypothetical protein [Campylobacter sp.]
MNKNIAFFGIFSVVLLIFISQNFSKIDTDIYNIITKDKSINQVVSILDGSFSNDFNILSKDPKILKNIKDDQESKEIFYLDDEIDFVKILSDLKLASLKHKKKDEISKDLNAFLGNSASLMLGVFDNRVLSPQDDLLNLSKFSSILDNKIKFDFTTSLSYIEFKENKYYFLNLKVKDSSKLISFYEKIKNNDLIIHSPLLYSLYGKKQGNFESIYMSLCSMALLGVFVFFAFGRIRVLLALSVIVFSFLLGLGAGFLFFKSIHILSIVISTSLAGLILDFTMHFLADNYKKKIKQNSIKKMLKIFLIGLSISVLGYLVFLFAFMPLLSQIAVISIFTLFGAFLASYFLLPVLFDGCIFRPNSAFKHIILFILNSLKVLTLKQNYILIFFVVLSAFSLFLLFKIDFKDNIKNYMSQPEILLKDSAEFSKIMDSNFDEILVLKDKNKEQELINKLEKNALIDDYNAFSKYFLSIDEQKELKALLIENIDNISKYYNFIDEADIKNSINSIKVFDVKDYKDANFITNKFLLADDSSLIFLKNPKKNEIFREILDIYSAKNINITQSLNSYFTELKLKAIYLKICAYFIAWLILIYFYGFKMASFFTILLLSANIICIGILYILNIDLNVFSIFGLIIASAIGMDYLIIAKNTNSKRFSRILSIILALFTSLISFGMLCFSSVYAVFSFGVSVCLGMFLMGFLALFMIGKKCC